METFSDQHQIFGNAKILRSRLNSTLSPRESENISRILVEHITGEPYQSFLIDPQRKFSPAQFQAWKSASQQLLQGVPFQYVIGQAWFGDLLLHVGPGVLIPRPETEELAQWIEDCLRAESLPGNSAPPKILDIGTGSGCIALHIAHEIPTAEVHAADVSGRALDIASKNAQSLGLPIAFHHIDILEQGVEAKLPGPFDLIVSNPPYIPYKEKADMAAHVKDHEPGIALFVPDSDPLLFYRRIAELGKVLLTASGRLFFEIHEDLGEEVEEMLEGLSYKEVVIKQDMQLKARMITATT